MAFSGTVSQTVFNTRRVIEHAARRCRLPAEQITAETVDIAKDQLYLMLSDWGNQDIGLWTLERQLYPLYAGVDHITLDVGTIDVAEATLRWLQPVTGANTTSPTDYTTAFGSATFVSTVGIKWSGDAVPLVVEQSNDGTNWAEALAVTPVAASGAWTWLDLPVVTTSSYIRVRVTSGTLSVAQVSWGNTPTEIPMGRLNRDSYTQLPNKTFQSLRPLQFWFDRQVRQPVMRLWPVPNTAVEAQQIVVWRKRHIMDVGSLTQEIEVPQRWYEAVVAGLAAKLALELVDVDPGIVPTLDTKAAAALYTAQMEERDRSPIMIAPDIGAYTR